MTGTPRTIIDSCCTKVGVVLATDAATFSAFANAGSTFTAPASDKIKTCRDLVMWVCQITGTFARMTRTGQLEVVPVRAGEAVRMIHKEERFTTTASDFAVKVSKVAMQIEQTEYSQGSGSMVMTLEENSLLANKEAPQINTALANILAQVTTAEYIPFASDFIGDPSLQPGDWITLLDMNTLVTDPNSPAIFTHPDWLIVSNGINSIITHSTWRYRSGHNLRAVGKSALVRGVQSQQSKAVSAVSVVAQAAQALATSASQSAQLINDAIGGYILIRQVSGENNEILIMDNPDPALAMKIWRWNLGGLGYSDNVTGADNPARIYDVAMTMDGSIVANFIKTGELYTNLVKITGDTNFFWDGAAISLIDPTDSNNLIQISKEGIRFSRDGGNTWIFHLDYDGSKVYDNSGDLRVHLGRFETGDVTVHSEDTQTDLATGTLADVVAVLPGDLELAKEGADFNETATLTADFDGTHSNTQATSDEVRFAGFYSEGNGLVSATLVDPPSTVFSGNRTLGYAFTVGSNSLTCTKLRWKSSVAGVTVLVRLWNSDGSALLASANVVCATANQWYETAITPVTLAAGAAYVIGGDWNISWGSPHRTYLGAWTNSSYITNLAGRSIDPAGFGFPDINSGSIFYGIPDFAFYAGGYTSPGTYTHHEQDVSGAGVANAATLTFNKSTPANTTLRVDYRIYSSGAWGDWQLDVASSVTIIPKGTNLTGYKFQWRAYLTTTDFTVTPALLDVVVSITSAYKVTGNRESPEFRISKRCTVTWSATLNEQTLQMQSNLSRTGGFTWEGWQTLVNGGTADGTDTGDLSNARLKLKEIESTADVAVTPKLHSVLVVEPPGFDFGAWFKNCRLILQDPPFGQGIEVWEGAARKLLIGRLLDNSIGVEIVDGLMKSSQIYGTLIRSGNKGDTSYIELQPGFEPLSVVEGGKTALTIWSFPGAGGQIQFYHVGLNDMCGQIYASNDIYGQGLTIHARNAAANKNVMIRGAHVYILTDAELYVQGDINCTGHLTATGGKSAKQETATHGYRYLYARESPDCRYIVEGKAQLIDGECRIDLDPVFLECIEPDAPETPWMPGNLIPLGEPVPGIFVKEIGDTGFTVKELAGQSNAEFYWSLSAVRVGFGGKWLDEAPDNSPKIDPGESQ